MTSSTERRQYLTLAQVSMYAQNLLLSLGLLCSCHVPTCLPCRQTLCNCTDLTHAKRIRLELLILVIAFRHGNPARHAIACYYLRYYDVWWFVQFYAVVFLRWPKQPHHWASASQETKQYGSIRSHYDICVEPPSYVTP